MGIDMFEWLEEELAAIKTQQFHKVDGPADNNLKEAIEHSSLPVSLSYKEFVLRFGNAKLYRNPRNDSYHIGVFASPKMTLEDDGTQIYHIGFHDGASVYMKVTGGSNFAAIFESESGNETSVADDFGQWLKQSCAQKRMQYTAREWDNLLRGSEAFNAEEMALLKARRLIHWRWLGLDELGRHIFEISNNGSSALPVLTLGVRSKDRRLNGAIRLDIGHILPGQTKVLHVDCYKDLLPPTEIEPFDLPDPQPEDRERFWEFGKK